MANVQPLNGRVPPTRPSTPVQSISARLASTFLTASNPLPESKACASHPRQAASTAAQPAPMVDTADGVVVGATATKRLSANQVAFRSHHSSRRAMHRGTPISGINPTRDPEVSVRRTYISDIMSLPNTTLQNDDGKAWSAWVSWDSSKADALDRDVLQLMGGAPYAGLDEKAVFNNYAIECLSLDNVFKTRRFTKATINVINHTIPVNVGNMVYYDTEQKTPVEFPTSGFDAGVVYLFPWSGLPEFNIQYNTGTPDPADPIDFERHPEVLKFPLQADKVQVHSLAVRPMQLVEVPYDGDVPSGGISATKTFSARPLEPMNTQFYRQSLEDLSGYLFGIYWYHPQLNDPNISSGDYNIEWYVEFEFEWSGIRVPEYQLDTPAERRGSSNYDVEALAHVLRPPVLVDPSSGASQLGDLMEAAQKRKADRVAALVRATDDYVARAKAASEH